MKIKTFLGVKKDHRMSRHIYEDYEYDTIEVESSTLFGKTKKTETVKRHIGTVLLDEEKKSINTKYISEIYYDSLYDVSVIVMSNGNEYLTKIKKDELVQFLELDEVEK
jgi:hypothetical protein